MTKHVANYFDNIGDLVDDADATGFAMSVMCTVVGALTLSRVMSDEEMSNKLLLAARKAILEHAEMRASS
jgi:TetR/AcrR family transcriptional repressor of nem operon